MTVNHGGPAAYTSPAVDLAMALRRGSLPAPIQVPFPLTQGEQCVGIFDGPQEQWLAGSGEYVHKSVAWAGGVGGLMLGGAMNMIGNSRRRAAAAREAAEQWRWVDHVRAYVTTERIALQGARDWQDYWYSELRTLNFDAVGVIVQMTGLAATRLPVQPVDYWFVLLRKLAFGDVYDVTTGLLT